ncbi:hypothetical protein Dimus_023358 [Dionaea muscipula]
MDEGARHSLFINDGSFMERFKQLQEEQEKGAADESKPTSTGPGSSVSSPVSNKTFISSKPSDSHKNTLASSGGKLAFSFKQKSKLVVPAVKLDEDEDEETDAKNAQADSSVKLGRPDASYHSPGPDVAPPLPSDPTVKKVADKLASFVAKNGRQFEHITRQRNPGDTPFKFLIDASCADYKYYEYRLLEEEKALQVARDSQASRNGSTSSSSGGVPPRRPQSNYQIPASALYEAEETDPAKDASGRSGDSNVPSSGSDPIAMMEYYMKKAAQEERRRPLKHSRDEMPPPASLQGPGKRGHHMGHYIPLEELEKFLTGCNDASAQKAAREAAERAKIQSDNVGHKLLSKMGWREGEGLGSSRKGIADPIMAGDVKKDNLGVGAHKPGEVLPEDDIYEQYKKRMMLGYRHRPNPLGNPRKAYY